MGEALHVPGAAGGGRHQEKGRQRSSSTTCRLAARAPRGRWGRPPSLSRWYLRYSPSNTCTTSTSLYGTLDIRRDVFMLHTDSSCCTAVTAVGTFVMTPTWEHGTTSTTPPHSQV